MKKKILSVMLALTMITAFMPIIASASEKYDDVFYVMDEANENALIVGCDHSVSDLVIPDKINGKHVKISAQAFMQYSTLTSVVIPDGVDMEWYVFYGCNNLESVRLPSDITAIGGASFQFCEKLQTITIPNGVTSIGSHAFEGCSQLNNIVLPGNLKSVEFNAFKDCNNLTDVYFTGTKSQWDAVDMGNEQSNNECLKNASIHYAADSLNYDVQEDNTIIITGCETTASNIKIPSEIDGLPVTAIKDHAFKNSVNLKSVVIADGIKRIGEEAFYYCSNLSNVLLPNSVTDIDRSAFMGCSALKSLTIPDGVVNIGNRAFAYCGGLTSITIPNSVKSIDSFAFEECWELKSLRLPGSLEKLGNNLVSGCGSFKDIYYYGTKSQWNTLLTNTNNEDLINANIHYITLTTPDAYSVSEIKPTNTGIALTINPAEAINGEQTAIVACYDENGVFTGMQQKQVNSSDGEQTLAFDIDKTKVSNVKAFIWNDLNYMMPASETKTLDLNNSENQEVNVTFTQNEDGTIELTWDNTEYPNYYFKIVDSNGNKVTAGWNTQGFSKTGDIATYLPRVDTHSTFSFILYSGTEDFDIGEEIARVENCFDISVDGDPLEYDIAFNTPEKNNHTVTLKSTIPAGIRHISAFYRNDKIYSSGSGYSSGDIIPGYTLTEVTALQDGDVFDLRMLTSYKLEGQVLKATMTPASTTTYKAVTE